MDPSFLLLSTILLQLSTTGLYFVYDFGHKNGLFGGLKNDTQKYLDGELWWWEVRDDDIMVKKRIQECNKAVANPNNAAIKSIFCIIQSWKLKVKMDAMNVAKDAASFVSQHKDFFLLFSSVIMALSILKRAYERQKPEAVGRLDACSYKSSHFVKRPDYEINPERNGFAKEMLDNWKANLTRNVKASSKTFYKASPQSTVPLQLE